MAKRPLSDIEGFYAGPEDFMQAGVRGFLVTTAPDKEELALDQAMKLLRKACVKLYGGIKPVKSSTALFSCGYIAVDFANPDTITVLPNPEAPVVQDKENGAVKETEEDNKDGAGESGTEKMEVNAKEGEDASKEETMETDKSEVKTEEAGNEDASEVKEETQEEGDDKKDKEVDGDQKEKKEKTKDGSESDKTKSDTQKKSSRDDKRNKERDRKRKRRDEENVPKWQLMKTVHKFRAYRTELRNIMFIKSDVKNLNELAEEIMNFFIKRKPLKADAITQLLPIQGICDYSYWELEVMSKRVLAPFFNEEMEEPPSFAILVFDKLSDPGTDVLAEIVRSAIWGLNPGAWQSTPMREPDVTIHLELIGSKLVLSAMANYIKYRNYSPYCLAELGEGKPEGQEEEGGSSGKDKPDSGKDKGGSKNQKTPKKDGSREKSRPKSSGDDEKKESKKGGDEKAESKEDDEMVEEESESKENGKKDTDKEGGVPGKRKYPTKRGKRGGVRKRKNNVNY